MVLRSGIPVGPLELADHLPQLRDPSGRRAEGLVHRGVGSRHRQAAVEDPRADEISTWGTPTIARTADGREELVTNGTKIRGYDPATGKQLWTLGPNSEITIGTPVVGNGLVFVTGGYPPVRPIYAIRPGAEGDISLPKGQESSQAIAWSNMTRGHVHPDAAGVRRLSVHPQHQRHRHGLQPRDRAARVSRTCRHGRIIFGVAHRRRRPTLRRERGRRGLRPHGRPGLAQVAKNDMKEIIMATPAISDGVIVVRTLGHLYGIGQ